MTTLSFGNYNSATTNGSQLGTMGFAANNLSMGTNVPQAQGVDISGLGTTDTSTVLDDATGSATGGSGPGFWSRDGGAGLILGGVQVLGNLWSSYQAHKMAKEQMAFAREQWQTNLANQTQTYNTALEDRIRARHHTEGRAASETDAYLEEHSL